MNFPTKVKLIVQDGFGPEKIFGPDLLMKLTLSALTLLKLYLTKFYLNKVIIRDPRTARPQLVRL